MKKESVDAILIDSEEACALLRILHSQFPGVVRACLEMEADCGYLAVEKVRGELGFSVGQGSPFHFFKKEDKVVLRRLVEIGIKFHKEIGLQGCSHTCLEHKILIDGLAHRIDTRVGEFTEEDRKYLEEMEISL